MILTHLVMFGFVDGASLGDTPAPTHTFNNNTQNWLAPSMHLAFMFGACLYAISRLSP